MIKHSVHFILLFITKARDCALIRLSHWTSTIYTYDKVREILVVEKCVTHTITCDILFIIRLSTIIWNMGWHYVEKWGFQGGLGVPQVLTGILS